ncbi:MAG: hypothetical protein WC523_04315 [Patescibacteria group bacterium]
MAKIIFTVEDTAAGVQIGVKNETIIINPNEEKTAAQRLSEQIVAFINYLEQQDSGGCDESNCGSNCQGGCGKKDTGIIV